MTDKQQAEASTETPDVPPIKVDPELWHHSESKDDRRNKSYYRKVMFGVRVFFRDSDTRYAADRHIHHQSGASTQLGYVNAAIDTALKEHTWPVRVQRHVGWGSDFRACSKRDKGGSEGYEFVYSLACTAMFTADKPSLIPSEDECIEQLGGADAISKLLVEAIEHGLWRAQDERDAYERARVASLMVSDYAERVEQRALKNTRWDQRYAALVAEYKAELEIQTAELLAELGDEPGVKWSDAPDFVPDERSTKAAKATLPKIIAEKRSPAKRGLLFRTSSDKLAVDVEDVR